MHVSQKTVWRPHVRSPKGLKGPKVKSHKPKQEAQPVVLPDSERYQQALKKMAERPGQPSLQAS